MRDEFFHSIEFFGLQFLNLLCYFGHLFSRNTQIVDDLINLFLEDDFFLVGFFQTEKDNLHELREWFFMVDMSWNELLVVDIFGASPNIAIDIFS